MLTYEDLISGTIDKARVAIDRIRQFEPPEGYYVAFSGGKDSIVIMDLVKRSGVKFDAHYNITGIDPPELFRFIRDEYPEVKRNKPEITIWKLIVKKGMPPTRLARYCCEYLKERGGIGRTVVTGIRWAESARRSKRRMTEVCMRNRRIVYLHPIIDWSDAEVWEYIHENNLPYCKLYDEGFRRLGCILCPMNTNRKKEAQRWPGFYRKYLVAFDECIKKRLADGKESKVDWSTGESMMKWWLRADKKHKRTLPDQTIMFE